MKVLKVLVRYMIALLIAGFLVMVGFWALYNHPTAKPEVIEVTKVIEHRTEHKVTTHEVQAIYIDVPVIVTEIEYVDKPVIVYQTATPRYFTSLAEAVRFLKLDDTDKMEFTGEGLLGIDCDNFALILQANALSKGFLLNFENDGDHYHNTFILDNTLYGIEPQTDRIWKIEPLD